MKNGGERTPKPPRPKRNLTLPDGPHFEDFGVARFCKSRINSLRASCTVLIFVSFCTVSVSKTFFQVSKVPGAWHIGFIALRFSSSCGIYLFFATRSNLQADYTQHSDVIEFPVAAQNKENEVSSHLSHPSPRGISTRQPG